MLLIHPVTEVVRFLPALVATTFLGAQSGNHIWSLAVLGLTVVFAILRWFTTSYRIGPVHVQLRTGLFQKKLLSVPRSRIRSVDVESKVMHRLLGLSIVRIGTGQKVDKREQFELNALDAGLVPALRDDLMDTSPAAAPERPGPDGQHHVAVAPPSPEVEIAHFSNSWVRFAPFTATGVVIVAAVAGLIFQSGLGGTIADSDAARSGVDSAARLGIVALVGLGIVVFLVVTSVLACVRYLVVYGNLRVTDDGHRLRVGHGLLSTRHTTLDRDRLRGTMLRRPLVLRWAGGAKLDAVMTGVSAQKSDSSLVLPAAPLREATRVMTAVLADIGPPDAALVPLVPHGRIALRRRLTRALSPVLAVVAVLVVVQLATGVIPSVVWVGAVVALVAATALAVDRYRGLGHAADTGWLVTQYGSLDRRRATVESDGILGWTVRQSFFQRRAGVATIVAATAAGQGHYDIVDVPVERAWSIVEAAQPGAGDVWARR
ncbi:PH domain-containing protein [Rhodococcoides trifolii]|nr:PH domain-containing protein [Rhodococcus trifolii]